MFNENSRVKIPALIHLSKLGYEYIPRATIDKENIDTSCNIFKNIFFKSIGKLNTTATQEDLNKLLQDLILKLENDDLGRSFYLLLQGSSKFKIIDFDNFLNNSLHCTTELIYKNGDYEFRPDITIIINGLPLIFIEVKKPNNPEGILAEYKRMSSRFKNEKFKKFINLTQFIIYSNNMEYDNLSLHNLQGAFYATCVKPKKYHNVTDDLNISFNYFREEYNLDYKNILKDIDIEIENKILKDNNLVTLKNSTEFTTNKEANTPTNRILTSLLSVNRISFILKYAIAYVEKDNNIEKHIMRYPQIFATLAIANKLDEGIRKGVIWHTQGSGKTALAFYNVKYLTDYYQKRNIIARFFFIVDRIDLLKQSQDEFSSRGLSVNIINSKEEFVKFMNKVTSTKNDSGKPEITLVNIQKFSEDSKVCEDIQYNINLQNIYFLDEVHRGYKPSGSFLSNLINSDKNAILIGLTGTPLLQNGCKDYSTRELFGDYIHKYYYNKSIDDGYTLRLIREEISTSYKMQLKQEIAKLQVKQGDIDPKLIYSHENFIKPMLDYIIDDLTTFRKMSNDNVSAMVICASSEQAKALFKEFEAIYGKQIVNPSIEQDNNTDKLKAILILHDMHTKDIMNKQIKAYKNGFYNIVFVYNMLLTGFDAPILKKLYIARKIENHNLLQALTRVNRPYNKFRYGYVVDFVDISEEFKKTNEDYLQELVKEYDKEDAENFSKLFKTEEEILKDIENIKSTLFEYNTKNKEIFSQQISSITDRNRLLEISKALKLAKELYNIILFNDDYKLFDKLDFKNLSSLYIEVQNRLNLIHQSEILNTNNTNLINIALEDIIFKFTKLSEAELIIADKLQDIIRKTREALNNNFDKKDEQFILLKEEFERIFKNKDFKKLDQYEINITINKLEDIYKKSKELNSNNSLIQNKYLYDKKYAVVHKRLLEKNDMLDKQRLFDGLISIKEQTDDKILHNKDILYNESYFNDEIKPIIIQELVDNQQLKNLDYKYVNNLIVKEYIDEYKGNII